MSYSSYGEIKVQGTSTARWPKKNWSLSFYADKERTQKLKYQVGNSIPSDKWIIKADWIDPTMLRNALSYRLWEAMTESRNVLPKYEVENAWYGKENMFEGVQTAAQGFPKNHLSHVTVDGEHYGIALLILGHDPDNFNIDKGNSNHMYFEFDARGGKDLTKSWEKFTSKGVGQWIDGYYPGNKAMTEKQLQALDDLGRLLNGSLEDFKKNFDLHLDKTNMIDMLLFIEAIYDWDAVAQDLEIVTYDLKKWYFLPWDKDTTFGMYYNGSGLMENRESRLVINYYTESPEQKPWFKTYHAFTDEVEKRYAELRDSDVFSARAIYEMAGDITKMIPKNIWQAEIDRWEKEGRPSLDETNSSQIVSWFALRLKTLDAHFNYKNES